MLSVMVFIQQVLCGLFLFCIILFVQDVPPSIKNLEGRKGRNRGACPILVTPDCEPTESRDVQSTPNGPITGIKATTVIRTFMIL